MCLFSALRRPNKPQETQQGTPGSGWKRRSSPHVLLPGQALDGGSRSVPHPNGVYSVYLLPLHLPYCSAFFLTGEGWGWGRKKNLDGRIFRFSHPNGNVRFVNVSKTIASVRTSSTGAYFFTYVSARRFFRSGVCGGQALVGGSRPLPHRTQFLSLSRSVETEKRTPCRGVLVPFTLF